MNKRVLMVAHTYYPINGPGAHRAAKFAKYLPKFGWVPVVLCTQWRPDYRGEGYDPLLAARPDVCRTVRVPYRGPPCTWVGKAAAKAAQMLWPYRSPLGLARRMLSSAEQLTADGRFDVIWATSPLGMTHYVASRIARRRGIPWVADFRDLPDQTYKTWRTRRAVRDESRICASAAALIAVSRPHADCLASRHRRPVHLIPNGFDPDDYSVSPVKTFEKFRIGYFGILYEFRSPAPLFAALDLLAARGAIGLNDIRVEFYGADKARVARCLEGRRCARVVEAKDRVTHDEMTRLESRMAVLLNIQSAEAGGAIPSKIFDYMAARRPVLNIPGDGGPIDSLIAETLAGRTAGTVDEVAQVVGAWYREWKSTGTVAYTGKEEQIALYTRERQTATLAGILHAVTSEGTGSL